MKTAKQFVDFARTWLGRKESDGTHKEIIDVYNSFLPRPRGYKMQYTDAWCATFVSAVAIKLNYTDLIPPECSCEKMIAQFKKLGIFVEDENRTPNVGDICFYDWQDDGAGDNKGWSDHVGIVTNVSRETFTVIEGNYGNAVKERKLKINAKNLRGFAIPKYDKEVSEGCETVKIEMPVLRKGAKRSEVKTLQRLLFVKGYSIGTSGVDGSFGKDTESAVKEYQRNHELEIDGVVGSVTWKTILKG